MLLPPEPLEPPVVAALVAWLTMVGACVGSFLNVVIYRLPAGLSIARPGSFCPQCRHPIRWHHNVPVLGWLLLRGRCYDCGQRISPRYPLVELLIALLFGGFAWLEVFAPRSFPLGPPLNLAPGAARDLSQAAIECGFHLLLMVSLIAIGFMEWDGKRVPRTMVVAVLLVGLMLGGGFPEIRPVHFFKRPPNLISAAPWRIGAADGFIGAVAGGLLAIACTFPSWLSRPGRWNSCLGLVLVGAFLGWQSVAVLACAAAILFLAATCISMWLRAQPGRWSWSGGLAGLTVVWLVVWRPLLHALPWLG
ncbi:MAG TPA: prepilin peptidase [Pirellulales bacterium]|jgi:leader peptidase (prepilin peptidase)/N-methyltransferase|nr:prepilin peptidase [Pirellulales bacterium]